LRCASTSSLIAGAVADDGGNGFDGLENLAGVPTIDGTGLANYDPLLKAVGVIRGNGATGPLAAVTHPWAATALDLLKESATENNMPLPRPPGVPPLFQSSQVPWALDASTIYVYDTTQVAVVRRQDTVVEVDRSEEFSSDAVQVRARLRATLAAPFAAQAVVKITDVPAPDPTA